MGRLLKFLSLPRREKHLFLEAGILLLLSNVCVKTIAFRHIDNFLRTRWRDNTGSRIDPAEDIRLVNRSILSMANLLPWQSLCLSRSIAEFIMLRRRGIPAVIYAGVRFSEHSSPQAHAWVQPRRGVNGGISENSAFTVVMRIGDDP
jgi:hypothetical protein